MPSKSVRGRRGTQEQSRSLALGDQGPEVAKLQDALRLLVARDQLAIKSPAEKEKLSAALAGERERGVYGEAGTLPLVKLLQKQCKLPVTGKVDARTSGAIDKLLKEVAFVVRGRIRGAAAKAIVRAYDKDLRSEQLLGSQEFSAANPAYEIRYKRKQFARAEKGSADLRIAVCDCDGRELASSAIVFNAPEEVTIDLSVGEEPRGPSELELYLAELKPVMQGVAFVDLTDAELEFLASDTQISRTHLSALRQSAIFAAQVSQQTQPAIQSSAHQSSKHAHTRPSCVSPAAFYGLLRQNLSYVLAELARLEEKVVRDALGASMRDNLIPALTTHEIAALLAALHRIAAEQDLEPAAPGAGASLGDLLTPVLEESRRGIVAAAYRRVLGEVADRRAVSADSTSVARIDRAAGLESLWGELSKAGLSSGEIRLTQNAIALDELTGGHAPLIGELMRGESIEPATLARFGEADWREILDRPRDPRDPASPPIGTPEEFTDPGTYARSLARQVAERFPTQAIAHQISIDQDPSSPFQADKQDLATFFERNPDFKIGVQPLEDYLRTDADAKLAGLVRAGETRAMLERIGRVAKFAPDHATKSALLKDNVDSAIAVMRMDKEEYSRRYGSAYGEAERAREAYDTASVMTLLSVSLYLKFALLANAPSAYVLDTGNGDAVDLSNFSESDQAVWRSMFGSLESCACVHCRSLNSPAAYLVDLLAFLRQQSSEELARPLEVLLWRRPDLAEIELTCDNTNIQVPYVDLANEILERAVAGRHEIVADVTPAELDAGTLVGEIRDGLALTSAAKLSKIADRTAWLIRDVGMRHVLTVNETHTGVEVRSYPQTSGVQAELAANPQHVYAPAYAILANSAYPWSLPFHLPVEQARAFLQQFGVERHELMTALVSPESQHSNDTIAHERLGLLQLEAELIAGEVRRDPARADAPIDAPWTLWGFAAANVWILVPGGNGAAVVGDWFVALRRVAVLLGQSGMKYVDLLNLLNTFFVNPRTQAGRALVITAIAGADPVTCDPARLEIPALGADALSRIHRFERLRRKLGWSALDLDRAIAALGGNALDMPFLRRLCHVKLLMQALRCTLADVLALWADIDVARYHDVTGTPGAPDLLPSKYDELFRNKAIVNPPDAAFTEDPAALAGTLAEHLPAISSALRIGAADIALLTSGPDAVVANGALTLANLTKLFRHALLARGLRLSVADLLRARALLGLDPFASTENTVSFVERAQLVRDARFDVRTLAWLLRHDPPDARTQANDDAQNAALLVQLRDGLRKADQETVVVEDPAGDVTRARLASLRWNPVHVEELIALFGDALEFEAPLAALPDGLEIPPLLGARFGYDLDAKQLRARGVLGTVDRQALLGLQSAAGANRTPYEDAVELLFTTSRAAATRFIKERMRTYALPPFAAPTDGTRLTLGFALPERWKDRLDYDARTGQLVAKVPLDAAGVADLNALSADAPWRAAVAALSAAPIAYLPDEADRFLILASGEVHPAVITLLFDSGLSVVGRFGFVLDRACGYLRRTLRESCVTQTLSEAMRLDAGATDALLRRVLTGPGGASPAMEAMYTPNVVANGGEFTRAQFVAQFELLTRLRKIAAIATRLRMTAEQITELGLLAGSAGWLDWNALPGLPGSMPVPFTAFRRLVSVLESRGAPLEDAALPLLKLANEAGTTLDAFHAALARASEWPIADIEALGGSNTNLNALNLLGLQFPADYRSGAALARMRACFRLLTRLGATPRQLGQWAIADLAAANPPETLWTRALTNAAALRNAVKSKYDASEWLTVARTITDKLRDRQRAALVACLIARGDYGREESELYDYFLIDVEMCACMSTTRIRQALCSVQLFVQRTLMNIENDARLTPAQAEQWNSWRKLYRVWEANRKVLLYPENWMEAELRDDKSPLFKQLESELLQNDVTNDNAQQALRNYLDRLHQVARLEIVGMCSQDDYNGTGQTALHVFGRTYAVPHVYFYRRRHAGIWSPWEKMEVDVEGDHLIPTVWNGHLYLFWALFSEKSERVTDAQRQNNEDPDKYLEIKLAWSELKQGKWVPRKLSSNFFKYLKMRSPLARQEPETFKFLTRIETGTNGSRLLIECYGPVFHIVVPPPPPPSPAPPPPLGDLKVITATWGETTALNFTVNGAIPDSDVLDMIEVVARRSDNGAYLFTNRGKWWPVPFPPHVIGGVLATRFEGVDYFVKQESFKVNSITTPPAGQPWAWEIATIDVSPYHRATPVADAPPPRLPDLVTTPTSARALFVFDDCNGDVTATDSPYALQRTQLVPPLVGQSHYESMMIVEDTVRAGNADSFGAVKIMLARTPGKFRALMRPEGYALSAVPSLTVPFAYQDAQRAYMVDMVNAAGGFWGGNQKLHFEPLFHAWTCQFVETLEARGLEGFLSLATQSRSDPPNNFESLYVPGTQYIDLDLPNDPTRRTPRQDVDFSPGGSCSLYNWELFFHIPFLVATQLTRNQRFDEARRWFHFIFDPTSSATGGRERFWKFKPFHDEALRAPQSIEELIRTESAALDQQIAAWQARPFQPFVIARLRVLAFMRCVVMKYLENIIAWADQLFRRDTIESINEATQLYLLALRILGKRPQNLPPRARPEVQTFSTLGETVDGGFMNAIVRIESYVFPSAAPVSVQMSSAVGSLGTMPLFCIPPNDKLLGYWDTIAQRLYNIRHCLNIEGVERQLPVFDPPIDPALLVRAAALGVDLDSVLNDLYAPLPNYRFATMRQKAAELGAEVKSLGGALLAALEKKDAEDLALLRSRHELETLAAVKRVKEQQRDEARATLDGLNEFRKVVAARQQFYLGRPFLNQFEMQHLLLAGMSLQPMQMQIMLEAMAGILHLIPETKTGAPTTMGLTYGGSNVAGGLQSFAGSLGVTASVMNTMGSLASTMGGYQRRQDEWTHQADLATKELVQVDRQIAAAQIRIDIALQELTNHEQQTERSRELDAYLREKYTNAELYGWMSGQIAALYFQTYRLAYDSAKRAERAWRHELGVEESNFIQFGYWDSLKKGLLAGERLQLDIARMDSEFLDRNKREFEITKHVSMLSIDPRALILLRQTGRCELELPEALFDLDFPGHYMRRLKTVSVTIPCVAGPYSGVNCTLTLLRSQVRRSTSTPQGYAREPGDDARFSDSFGAIQSIVLSNAQNDSGVFDLSMRDERFLPFEGAGAISTWRLELPDFRAFDYESIADVILHVRYTARAGGTALRQACNDTLQEDLNEIRRANQQTGLVRLLSVRHEFPLEWQRLVSSRDDAGNSAQTLAIAKRRFPFVVQRGDLAVTRIDMLVVPKRAVEELEFPEVTLAAPAAQDALDMSEGASIGRILVRTAPCTVPVTEEEAEAGWTVTLHETAAEAGQFREQVEDILLVCHYEIE